MKLRFRYVNHQGDDHEYTIEPHALGLGISKGIGPLEPHWLITAYCIERDGQTRWDQQAGFPIRSFILADMRDIVELPA